MTMIASALLFPASATDAYPARPVEVKAAAPRTPTSFSSVFRSVPRPGGSFSQRSESEASPQYDVSGTGQRAINSTVKGQLSGAAGVDHSSLESAAGSDHGSQKTDALSLSEEEGSTSTDRGKSGMVSFGQVGQFEALETAANSGESDDAPPRGNGEAAGRELQIITGINSSSIELLVPQQLEPVLSSFGGGSDQQQMASAEPSRVTDSLVLIGIGADRFDTVEEPASLSFDGISARLQGQVRRQAARSSPGGGEELPGPERPESMDRPSPPALDLPAISKERELVLPISAQSGVPPLETQGYHARVVPGETALGSHPPFERSVDRLEAMLPPDMGEVADKGSGVRERILPNGSAALETGTVVLAGKAAEPVLDVPRPEVQIDRLLRRDPREDQGSDLPSSNSQGFGDSWLEAMSTAGQAGWAAAAEGERRVAGEGEHRAAAALLPSRSSPTLLGMDWPFHGISRSVVLEVAQPDLGHVNVRVTVSNDLVHAHLSPDRFEVGQYLVSGQERLQSALQASGLEMGQFRVDIDRQSTGRSFQQGQPQDSNRPWEAEQAKPGQDQGVIEPQELRRAAHTGLLNVIA